MNQTRVLAIVINWRQPEVTQACVRALQGMEGIKLQILVIDNGSGDTSPEQLRQGLPGVEVRALPENQGFAGGANVGLRKAMAEDYDFALLINNDAFAAPNMLSRLLAETSADVALLSPKIFYESEPERIWFAGAQQHPTLLELRSRGQGELDGPLWSETRDVDYLVGTCLLANVVAVRQVGFLDEAYFMYYEDLDWSLRFRQAGYRLRVVADAHLFHRVSVSTGGVESPIRHYHMARSSVLFFHRHAQKGLPRSIALYRTFSAIKTLGLLIARGKFENAKAHLNGLRDGYRLAHDSQAAWD